MTQQQPPDVCLFMLGVFDTRAGARMKKTDAFIDASPYPLDQLAAHNNPVTCPRERRAFVGQWKMCVIVRVPADRRLDVAALKMHWRRRSRTLEKRILFGVQLARALDLPCYADPAHLEGLAVDVPRAAANTLSGPPLCRNGESICFTLGSPDATALARQSEQRNGGSGDDVDAAHAAHGIDWERLARALVDEPTAALDATSMARQATALEMMLQSASTDARRAAVSVLAQQRSGPLGRVGRGLAQFENLRTAVAARCSDDAGEVDNRLLFEQGDDCYDDAVEFMTRPLERLRLHRAQLCVCGAQGTLTKRVHVRTSSGRTSRIALECTACGRNNAASAQFAPSLDGLRARIGLGEISDAHVIDWVAEAAAAAAANASTSAPVAAEKRPRARLPDLANIDATIDGALQAKRRRTTQ
jgi:hypothetical protein